MYSDVYIFCLIFLQTQIIKRIYFQNTRTNHTRKYGLRLKVFELYVKQPTGTYLNCLSAERFSSLEFVAYSKTPTHHSHVLEYLVIEYYRWNSYHILNRLENIGRYFFLNQMNKIKYI